jgi:2-iminoacetate synthase
MFSNRYELRWNELTTLASHPKRERVHSRLPSSSLDPAWAEALWNPEYGFGGESDSFILEASAALKERLFSSRVFPIVPLYVSSVCAEQCLYCNFRAGNKGTEVERVRLTDEQLRTEAEYLIREKGLRVLELVYASDPALRPDSMCRHVEIVQGLLDEYGGGIVGINAEALEAEEYRALVNSGLAFVVMWQETYDRTRYLQLHPGGIKKRSFEYRMDAYERMISAGIKRIGLGVLSGLADWKKDWAMLMHHESYLYEEYGVAPAILGIPRLKPAAGATLQTSPWIPSRQEFIVTVALHNLFSPRTMPFVNTREDFSLCVDLTRGGGSLFTFNCSTIPGGYSLGHRGYQFPTDSYDAPVYAPLLEKLGRKPLFDWDFEKLDLVMPGVERVPQNVPTGICE